MKKHKILIPVVLILIFSVIFLSSCAHGEVHDEIEESSSSDITTENNNNTEENSPLYKTPVILKTGNTPFYEGKTYMDLISIYKNNGKGITLNKMIPQGRVYDENDSGVPYIYDKLSGEFLRLCGDAQCNGEKCIWKSGEINFQFVSEEYIYFIAENALCRTDKDRNLIEKIKDVDKNDTHKVIFEKDNVLYIQWTHYVNNASTVSLYTYDMDTKEEKIISGDTDLQFVAIVNCQVYYCTDDAQHALYKTGLSFEEQELLCKKVCIEQYSEGYLILKEILNNGKPGSLRYSYNLKTGEKIKLNTLDSDVYLSGEYLYYCRDLTAEEIEKDPLKDYYNYRWEGESVEIQGGVFVEYEDANVKGAGKIYRINIRENNAKEECVFQLTYKGVPVRINEINVDGEVIYIDFHNYETCKNFYSQEFEGDEDSTISHALIDLQNGSLTILDLPREE